VLVEPIEQLWRETTDQPLQVFGGFDELTDGVSFYMPNHPRAAHVLDRIGSQADQAHVSRDGAVLLCPARPRDLSLAAACRNVLLERAMCSPEGKRREVEISRRYLGVEGRRERYILVTIPPRGPEQLTSLRAPVAEFAASHFPPAD
jgi:hypothetical protein